MLEESLARARGLFLREDRAYGCAETMFIALKEAYGLPEAEDSTAAMALNGGIASSGNVCGVISGAALAIGLLAGRQTSDHIQAKRAARLAVAGYMDAFQARYGSTLCRDLTGVDLRSEVQHQRFIESGVWRVRCMEQIDFGLRWLNLPAEDGEWRPNFIRPE